MKKKLYGFLVHEGLKLLSLLFPDVHMSVPMKPSERFLEYPFVVSHLPGKQGGVQVLDVGCSGSFFPLIISAMGYRVTACDIRPYEILTNLKFENFQFVRQDICKEPLQPQSFDVVTCISTLEHIGIGGRYGSVEQRDGDFRMVEALRRELKPGATALITVPYGIAEIVLPYHRIYDYSRVKELEMHFEVMEERFYCTDPDGNWMECSAEAGEKIRGSRDHYSLALLCLKTPGSTEPTCKWRP